MRGVPREREAISLKAAELTFRESIIAERRSTSSSSSTL